jgi:hypothetical protein
MATAPNVYAPRIDKETKLVVSGLKVYFPLRRLFLIGP